LHLRAYKSLQGHVNMEYPALLDVWPCPFKGKNKEVFERENRIICGRRNVRDCYED